MIIMIFILFCMIHAGIKVFRKMCKLTDHSFRNHFTLQLYNYFEDSNYVYLVLEICMNGELNRYLKANCKVLTEDEGQ